MMIIGHQKIWRYLRKLARAGRVSGSFLFSGEQGLGKRTLALEWIKLLYCQNSDFSKRPCQICKSCQLIQKNSHPDLILVEPLKNEIQISQIKELQRKLSLRPHSAQLKSAIIDQADLMNSATQSAFLKTLEEPKGNTVLILISEKPGMLLPTILSRTRLIKFQKPPLAEIKKYLFQRGVPEEISKKILLFSDQRPGWIIQFLQDPALLEQEEKKIKELIKLTNSDLAFRFNYVKDLVQSSVLKDTLQLWLRYFRGVLIQEVNHQKTKYIPEYSLAEVKKIVSSLQETLFLISNTNVNPRLALEILMLKL